MQVSGGENMKIYATERELNAASSTPIIKNCMMRLKNLSEDVGKDLGTAARVRIHKMLLTYYRKFFFKYVAQPILRN